MSKARPYSRSVLAGDRGQRTFSGGDLLQIAFPLGGMGAGCICLNGYGGLQDFSIRNKPATSAVPDGHGTTDAAFALLHVKGRRPDTRLVEGPMPPEKVWAMGTKGQGYRQGGYEGLPRFGRSEFKGEYPFGTVTLTDTALPLRVQVTGWSPFIPGDDVASGLPCAILEYALTNRSRRKVDFEFSFHMSHLAPGSGTGPEGKGGSSLNAVIPGGVHFTNTEGDDGASFGSAAISVVGHRPSVKAMWLRGGWFDSVSALWREISTGAFTTNTGEGAGRYKGRNGGSILLRGTLGAGASVTYPIVLAWHFPNCDYGAAELEPRSAESCCGPAWRPFYAGKWPDAAAVAAHVRRHYCSLRDRTQAFHDALFSTTAPSYVLDAVSANLGILKSPTLLRQENGNAWGWEGCFVDRGCCQGSCTHVWNYAQALPHLFPAVERTLREGELDRSLDDRGHVAFRSALPDGPTHHRFHAASDGQLGGIIKLYRDYLISGDLAWLKRLYPRAKKSLDYCIKSWDPGRTGVLVEPHHNTYDIEFWGPDGMCTSFYLGALVAFARIAEAVGRSAQGEPYLDVARKGANWLDRHLWNGEYYEQRVQYRGLKDQSFRKLVDRVGPGSGEVEKLLKREGPRYQYGTGCISDGVLGEWMAWNAGIRSTLPRARVRRNLRAIFEYNFRPDLSRHACPQRHGYACGHDAGLLLCSWPKGGKPTLPFVYSDEVWTGIEYQVASHLIAEGMAAEGLTIVKGVRDRHEGRTRNPWCEYECGNYYARAMSSYALLPALSGFRYERPSKTLHFGPKLGLRRFRSFFSTETGWGTISLSAGALVIDVVEGRLDVDRIVLSASNGRRVLDRSLAATPGKRAIVRL